MASVLRSTRCTCSLVGFAFQKCSPRSKVQIIQFGKYPGVISCNDLRIRTATLSAQKETEPECQTELDRLFLNLNMDIRKKNVKSWYFNNALNAVQRKGTMSHSHLSLLLECCSEVSLTCSEKDRLKMAESIWKLASDFGTEFNINHYNALIKTFLINHYKFSPSQFLKSLEKAGVKPNLETYRLLLKAYCSQGQVEEAKLLMNDMKESCYPLDFEDFNSLIQGYCENGDIEGAGKIFKIMEDRGLKPNENSFVYLLSGYAKRGDIDQFKKILNELPKRNIYLRDPNLLDIFWALSINNHDDQLIDIILEKMANTRTFNGVRIVCKLFDRKKDSLALKLLDTFKADNRFQNNIYICSPLFVRQVLTFFIRYRNPEEILDMCSKFEEKEFAINTLSDALDLILKMKNEDFCLSFFKAMKARKMKLKQHYFWPPIIKASKKGNTALFSFLKTLLKENLIQNFNKVTINKIILQNYKVHNKWKEDLETFKEIGIRTEELIQHFIKKFSAKNKFDEIKNLVQLPSDYRTSKFTLKIVRNYLRKYNDILKKEDSTEEKKLAELSRNYWRKIHALAIENFSKFSNESKEKSP